MADFKKLTINLSLLFTDQSSKSSPNSTSKSPRKFENSAIVGLGIVAAMNDWETTRHQAFASANSSRAAILAITSPRSNSNPIPIISDSRRPLMEFSENYAGVISHLENCNENTTTTACLATFRTSDFLDFCFLCKKKLHGLDIFMYRGEKAFCSAECRSNHIASDDHKEKCGSGLNYSVSPCSGPMLFFAGVAAA